MAQLESQTRGRSNEPKIHVFLYTMIFCRNPLKIFSGYTTALYIYRSYYKLREWFLYSLFEMWDCFFKFEGSQSGFCIDIDFGTGDCFIPSNRASQHKVFVPFLDLSKIWGIHSEFGSISKQISTMRELIFVCNKSLLILISNKVGT